MKINCKIQRRLLATLMVFASAELGLQPLVFDSQSQCNCSVNVAVDDSTATCCHESVEIEIERSCCSSKPLSANKCCCNPAATACQCGDCECGEDKTSSQPIPAIPASETNEVVSPTLICDAPFVGYPQDSPIKPVGLQNKACELAALTSQQTCVLLSRFTC